MPLATEHRIALAAAPVPEVSALHLPAKAPHKATLVFGHGAGADMRHRNLQAIGEAFAAAGTGTLRFNFPFRQAGKARVDAKAVCIETITAALAFAQGHCEGPFFLGGHRFGGRMATHAAAERELNVAGVICCAFPLHPPGKPGIERAAHLDAVAAPLLFLSGTRDGMANRQLLAQVAERVGAALRWLDTADHGYRVLKRSRIERQDVFAEAASHARAFVQAALSGQAPATA